MRNPRIALALTPLILLLAVCGDGTSPGQSGGGQPSAGAQAGTSGGGGSGGDAAGGTKAGAGSAGQSAAGGTTGGSGPAGNGGAGNGGAGSAGNGGAGGSAGMAGAGGKGGATGGASGGTTGGASGGGGTVDAVAMAKAMGFGTNIGNTFDNTTSWETGWGQPAVTQAYIKGMASHGIKTVRVPVAWNTYANNGVIDATKMNRVKEVVGWIVDAGMYAIVNIHWDGGWIFNEKNSNKYKLTDDVKTKFVNYWKQIGTAFSGVGHMLIMEALNEEAQFYVNGDSAGTPDIAALNTLNQLFVTTIRAQGGFNATRALLIAGFATDINKTCVDAFTVPTDPAGAGRQFLSIHFYDPYPFTLMEDPASWGSPSATWGTDAEKKALEDQFTKLGTFSTKKNIPVIIGEFAVTVGQKVVRQAASRSLWMQSVAKACFSRGMVPVLWDTGSEIKRTDGSLSNELQTAMNNAK